MEDYSHLSPELERLAPVLASLQNVRTCPHWEARFYSGLIEARSCKGDYPLTIWEAVPNVVEWQSYTSGAGCLAQVRILLRDFGQMHFLFLSSMREPPWPCFFGASDELLKIFESAEADEAFFVDATFTNALFDTHHWELISARCIDRGSEIG